MPEYIERDALLKVAETRGRCLRPMVTAYSMCVGVHDIEAAPAVDAVKVVRCRSCKFAEWSKKNGAYYCKRKWAMHKVRERDFCSYGLRRDNDATD